MAPSLNHWIKCHSKLPRELFREKHKSPIHVPMWRADCPSATVSYIHASFTAITLNELYTYRAHNYSTLDLRYRAYGYTLHVKTCLVNLGDQSILEKKRARHHACFLPSIIHKAWQTLTPVLSKQEINDCARLSLEAWAPFECGSWENGMLGC